MQLDTTPDCYGWGAPVDVTETALVTLVLPVVVALGVDIAVVQVVFG